MKGTAVRKRHTFPRRGSSGCTIDYCRATVAMVPLLALPLLGGAQTGESSFSPSILSVEVFGDDSGQKNFYLSLDLALSSGMRLGLEGELLQGGENIEDTTSLGVGVGSDPEKDFSVALQYRYRKQREAFVTERLGVDFVLFRGDWMLSFAPGLRHITLFTTELARRRRSIAELELESQAIEMGVGYFGFPSWGLALYHRAEDYSEDLTRIERHPRLAELLFSQGALNLAWGFDRSRTQLHVTYYFPHSTLALGTRFGSSISAIDDSTYLTLAGFADWDIAAAWGMTLEAGSADSDAGYLRRYLSAALRYRW